MKNLKLPFGYADNERLKVHLVKHGLVLLAYIEYDNGAFLRPVSSSGKTCNFNQKNKCTNKRKIAWYCKEKKLVLFRIKIYKYPSNL